MGVVYKAWDTHLDRFVALKILPPDRTHDPERKRRFVQEAKAASALNHPNILHVYDIETAGDVDFIGHGILRRPDPARANRPQATAAARNTEMRHSGSRCAGGRAHCQHRAS